MSSVLNCRSRCIGPIYFIFLDSNRNAVICTLLSSIIILSVVFYCVCVYLSCMPICPFVRLCQSVVSRSISVPACLSGWQGPRRLYMHDCPSVYCVSLFHTCTLSFTQLCSHTLPQSVSRKTWRTRRDKPNCWQPA